MSLRFKHGFVLLYLFLVGCKNYKQVYVRPTEFMEDKRVVEQFRNYRIIVHDTVGNVYTLSQARIKSDSVFGALIKVEDTVDLDVKSKENDVHFYLKGVVDSAAMNQSQTAFAQKEVKQVAAYAKNESKVMAGIGIILLAILGALILAYGVLVLLIFASGEAAEESSAGSNSDSDSNSGDNGSSDGSNSNSGCFIATMTYGSYDAPQVLVFRNFRDRFLQKYWLGRSFVNWYYSFSPSFVKKYQGNRWMRGLVKICLTPLLWCLFINYRK